MAWTRFPGGNEVDLRCFLPNRPRLQFDPTDGEQAHMGAGVSDRLREQPKFASRVYGVNSAGRPRDPEEFVNIRM